MSKHKTKQNSYACNRSLYSNAINFRKYFFTNDDIRFATNTQIDLFIQYVLMEWLLFCL